MLQNVFQLKADLKKKSTFVATPEIVQNDNVRFEIEVTDNGKPLALDNVQTVSLAHSTKGETVVTSGEIEGNKVIFNLGTLETKYVGQVNATVQLYDAEGRISTIKFPYYVVSDPTGKDYVPSEKEQTLIEVVMSEAQAKIDELSQVDVVDLKEKQDEFTAQLAQTEEELSVLDNQKMDRNTIDIAISQINKNKGKIDQTYLSDALLQQITGNAPINATPARASITRDMLTDKVIGVYNTDFTKVVSNNIFNKNTALQGLSYNNYTGEPTESASYFLSEFIRIKPLMDYTFYTIMKVAFYDNSFEFISTTTLGNSEVTVTPPENSVYMRVAVDGSHRVETAQINKGSELLDYDEFKVKLDNMAEITNENIGKRVIETDNLEFDIVTPLHTTFFKYSSNLFNTEGSQVNKRFNSSGVVLDSEINSVSDYIPIKPNTTYTQNRLTVIVLYDEGFNQIEVVSGAIKTFTTSSDAAFLRASYQTDRVNLVQLNESESLLEYEPHYKVVKEENLPEYVKPSDLEKEYYTVPETLTGWYEAPVVEGYEAPSHYEDNVTIDDIYNEYEDMATNNPNYVTKTLLGNDATDTYPLYKYEFNPEQVDVPEEFNKGLPKIMLFPSLHGEEKSAAISLRNFMRDVCQNWKDSPILEYIRWNVHLIIVPIGNPYGFMQKTRVNGRGVDINRNFDNRWDLIESTEKGDSPFSEKETQYIRDLVLENLDAVAVIDYHMNGSSGDEYKSSFWHSLSSLNESKNLERLYTIAEYNVSKITREAQKRYGVPENSGFLGYVSQTQHNPTLSNFGASKGIMSATFECTRKIVGEENVYSALTLQLCTEYIGNAICNIIKTA